MDFFVVVAVVFFLFIIIIVFIYCGGCFWTAVTGHRCKALEDFPVAAAGSLAVSSGSCVDDLELPLGLSRKESADELPSMFGCHFFFLNSIETP